MTEIKNLPQLLESYLKTNNVKIKDCVSHYVVPAGENYGGIILALDVTVEENGETKIKNFIAKLIPTNEKLAIMFNIQNTFKRELDLYTDIIPMLISFQKEFNIDENSILNCFPKCVGARLNLTNTNTIDENGVILLENLKTQGYVMEDRMIGFDLEATKLIITNLARFHAIPIALKHLKPDVFNTNIASLIPYSFGDGFSEEMKQHFTTELSKIITEIGYKNYAEQIADLVYKGLQFEERFIKPKGQYLTIAHHDLWANNIMVLKNYIGQPNKIMLYDLQMTSYGSLAHDLLFFLFSSVRQDVFNNYYDDLIQLYYDSFIKYLKEFNLNTEIYSRTSFIKELNDIGPKQISHIIIMLRPIFMEKNQVSDMADMNENEMSALHALNSRFKIKLRNCIMSFIERKWL